MVREVDSNLLKGPVNEKGSDRVGNWLHSAHCQARTHGDHICFGHAAIDEPFWVAFLVFVKKPVSNITRQQNDRGVRFGNLRNFICKGVSHFLERVYSKLFKSGLHFFFCRNTIMPVVVVLHHFDSFAFDRIGNDGEGLV